MLSKLLRLGEGRMVKRLARVAEYVNALADDVEKLTDEELRAKTGEFKNGTPKAKASTTYCPKPSPLPGRRLGACLTSGPSTCR